MENRQATRDDYYAHEQEKSPNNIYTEREGTFHAVADAFVSEDKPATFQQDPVVPSMSDQILVRDVVTGIPFHVEELLTKLVLKIVVAQHKEYDDCLFAALASLIDRVVGKMVSSPDTIAQSTVAVVDNPGFIAPSATLVKSQLCNDMDKRAKSEELCR